MRSSVHNLLVIIQLKKEVVRYSKLKMG